MKKLFLIFTLLTTSLIYSQAASKVNNAQNVVQEVEDPDVLLGCLPANNGLFQVYEKDSIKWETYNIKGLHDTIVNIAEDISTTGFYPLVGNPSNFLISYTETDPEFDTKFAAKNTSGLTEGSNLYYTASRFNTAFSEKSTTDLTEGTNQYFTQSRARLSLSAGIGISYNNSTGVISAAKKQETSSGTTNASGTYTFTFANTYSVAPNVQANIINGTDTQIIRIGTPSTTSVTVTVRNRTDVVGLLPSWSNVNGATVDIIITEK